MADFNILDHLRQAGFGQGGGGAQKGGDDGANEKDIIQNVVEGTGKGAGTVGKMVLGINVASLGEVSIDKVLGGSTEGLAGKTIPSLMSSLSTSGGFLAKLLHDVFVKNREITDHTAGVGGSAGGEGGGSGGGGDSGSSSGSGHFEGASYVDFSSMASPNPSFNWSEASFAMLGGMSPQADLPSRGMAQNADMGMSA